jgi:hypothetical protein
VKEWEIRQILRDQDMRRALLELLQEATKKERSGYPTMPEPMRDDEQVTKELHRILGIKKGFFERIKEGLFII